MRIITQSKQRETFAEKIRVGTNDDGTDKFEFMLSLTRETESGRRPVNRYDTEQELIEAANARNCRVTWLTS